VAAVRAGELTAHTLTDERFKHFIEMTVPFGRVPTPSEMVRRLVDRAIEQLGKTGAKIGSEKPAKGRKA
jgi:hypothetical protein